MIHIVLLFSLAVKVGDSVSVTVAISAAVMVQEKVNTKKNPKADVSKIVGKCNSC